MRNLILLIFLSIFSFSSFSNPLLLGFEAAMRSYLLSIGNISNSDAEIMSKDITKDTFASSDGACRAGRFTNSCKVEEALIENAEDGKIKFTDSSGNNAEIQAVDMIGKYSSEDILRRLYKNSGYGNLIFHEKKTFQDEYYSNLRPFIQDGLGRLGKYAIAPLSLASTGLFVYRTAKPIKKNGLDYLYADDLATLYFYYYINSDFEDLSEKTTKLTILTPDQDDAYGTGLIIPIHTEQYLTYYKHDDPERVNQGFDEPSEITSSFNLKTYLMLKIFDIDKEQIDTWKEIAELDGGTAEAYYDAFDGAFDDEFNTFTTISRVPKSIDVIRSLEGVTNKNQTLKNIDYFNQPENISLISNYQDVSNDVANTYVIDSDDLAKSYNKIAQNYFEKKGHVLNKPSGGTVTIPENKPITKSNLSFSTNSPRITLASFRSTSSASESVAITYPESDRVTPSPAPATDTGETSGTGRDVNISNDGSTSSGSSSGANASSSSSASTSSSSSSSAGVGSNTNAGTRTVVEEKPVTKEEEKEEDVNFDGPEIPEITGLEILQPLIDLKNSLISKLDIASVSGSCPTYNIDIFGTSITLDIHCKLFQTIAPIISGLMLLVYNLIALRIILSS